MSLNGFMHPRNIYRTKPNFAEMAANYPSFAAFVGLDSKGKSVIDYNDCNALRQLTITLLKKDFDLEVDIPDNRLIPTVPQRLNYVLWVEDLVSKLIQFLQIDDKHIIGLDIGTGSCAIFPLIGSAINKNWHFVATDVDPFNIECAQKNVNQNDLNQRIKVIQTTDESYFRSVIDLMFGERIHFSMTNPPFFSDHFNDSDDNCHENDTQIDLDVKDSKFKSNLKSRKKSSANTSILIESVAEGGEVGFVSKMIEQSLLIRETIMIYSAMLGKKRSLLQLKNIIKQYIQKGMITSFVSTEFCQGITKRWGIAWTFISGLDLKQVPSIKSVKSKPPLVYFVPPLMKETKYDLQSISERIKSLLINDLQIDSFEVKENKKSIEFIIKANKNSWSNQRKRRREAKFKSKCDSINDSDKSLDQSFDSIKETLNDKFEDSCDMEITTDNNSMKTVLDLKRRIEEDLDNDQKDNDFDTKKTKTRKEYFANQLFLLHCSLSVKREKQSIFIQLQTREMAQNQESTYQLFQYFKNNLI